MASNVNHTQSEPTLPDFAAVLAARRRIAGQVILTPCTPSDAFTDLWGGRVWFKFDNLQRTGSFKERGARNKLESLPEEQGKGGVIAASAGNHAQGVAFHAAQLGIAATIVMPERTPLIKVSNTEQFGARVVLHGENYDEAMAEALRIREMEDLVLIHPFNDPDVIAGQGTIGLELLEQNGEIDAVIVPIGGGGLISGIAMAIKERRPEVQVIGVEAEVVPAALRAREAGHPVTIPDAETIADGISVRRIGDLTFRMIERYVDRIVTVSEEEIANAVLLLLEREKTVVEGAAATPLAALLNGRVPEIEGKNVTMLLCGGNIDVNLLSRIIDRGLIKDGRLVSLRVRVSDRPGALAALTARVAEKGANILRLDHHRGSATLGIREAEVAITLETKGPAQIRSLIEELAADGYSVWEE